MKSLQDLLARLKELNGELTVLVDKKDVPEAERAAHLTSIQTKTAEIEAVEAEVAIVRAAEGARARAALPASAPAGTTAAAHVAKKLTSAEKISIVMKGMVQAFHDEGVRGFRPTMKALADNGYGLVAEEFTPAQGRALVSSSATAGGILLPESMSMDIIDILRPNVTFLQGGPRVVPMPNGTYKLPKAASGATASYRGETKPAGVSEPTFRAINMSAKLEAAIVPISNQLIRWSGPNIDSWATMDLSNAMGRKMDYMAYFGDGAEDTPLGITNIPGIGTRVDSGEGDPTKPTYTEVDAAVRQLRTPIESYSQLMMGVAWRMAPRVFDYLADMRNGQGNLVYPTLQGDAPTFKGFPCLKTTQFPTNLGIHTDESVIALIAFGHTLFGDALRMQLAISMDATIVNGANTINAFQDGVTIIKAEAEHDFDIAYAEAVQVLTGVRWGA